MIRPTKDTPMLTSPPQAQSGSSVPAAWPNGVSPLAQAVDACQRPDAHEVSADWQVRVPKAIQRTPTFRRNAVEVTRDKAAREHG